MVSSLHLLCAWDTTTRFCRFIYIYKFLLFSSTASTSSAATLRIFFPFLLGTHLGPGASQVGFVVCTKRRRLLGTTQTGKATSYQLDIDVAGWMFWDTAPEILRLGRAFNQRKLRSSAHNLVAALELDLLVIQNIATEWEKGIMLR